MTQKFRKFVLPLIASGIILLPSSAMATEDTLLPEMPTPLQNLASQGAQIRFLGKDFGVNGWVAIKNGREQYFYVLPNGGFISGVLHDQDGKMVTVDQVRRLRSQSGDLLDKLTEDNPQIAEKAKQETEKYEFKTPSEQLYWDLENSNWVPVGQAGTPLFYSFINPQCGHCHKMMEDIKPYVESGQVQVRMIPVGNTEETVAQSAYLLATPAPSQVWWKYLGGDKTALPAKREINQQGVQRNLAVMQSWKLDITPLLVYRDKDQKVKIVRGKPKDLEALIKDLGARS